MKKILLLLYFSFLLVSLLAQVPKTMSFQGVLTDPLTGEPVPDGTYNFTLSLFDGVSGGAALWTEVHNNKAVARGLYNLTLGGNGSPLTMEFSIPLYLEVQVGTEILTPRIPLTSSAYSLGTTSLKGSGNTMPSTGNVGIGTLTPTTALQVVGVVQATSFTGSGTNVTALNASNINSGTLNVANGGTGVSTISGVLVGNATSPMAGISSSAANQYLRRNAGNTAYEFGSLIVTGAEITNASITSADLANGSVTGGVGGIIADGTITSADLANGSISGGAGGVIVDGSIIDVDISASANISGSKIGSGISASNITSGTLSDARLESTVDITALNVSGAGQFGSIGSGVSPGYPLDVQGNSTDYVCRIYKNNAAGSGLVRFDRVGTGFLGSITETAGTVSYNAFTGSHLGSSHETVEIGILQSLTGAITYINDSFGEPIYGVATTSIPNDSKVMGSFLHSEKIENKELKVIMAVGNGEMWVADNGSDLLPGDFLISSSTKGHAMKDVGDYDLSYVIARVAAPVSWAEVNETIEGVKHKRVSVFFESFIRNNRAEKLEHQLDELMLRVLKIENQLKIDHSLNSSPTTHNN